MSSRLPFLTAPVGLVLAISCSNSSDIGGRNWLLTSIQLLEMNSKLSNAISVDETA
jgi:hypothetical protein